VCCIHVSESGTVKALPQQPPWRQKRVAIEEEERIGGCIEVSILERLLLDKWRYNNN